VPVHYATAKAGVTGFTLALAKELARYNVRVLEVVPGLLSKGVARWSRPRSWPSTCAIVPRAAPASRKRSRR